MSNIVNVDDMDATSIRRPIFTEKKTSKLIERCLLGFLYVVVYSERTQPTIDDFNVSIHEI